MKLKDVIQRLDKSSTNEIRYDVSEFCEAIERFHLNPDWEKFEESFKFYWVTNWICTDAWVGLSIGFLNDDPVCTVYQHARRSSIMVAFFSKEAADKVFQFLESIIDPRYSAIDLVDLDMDIQETYNVDYSSELLTKHGYVDSKPVKVVDLLIGSSNYGISHSIKVQYKDGVEEIIAVNRLRIPIHLSGTNDDFSS
jgi:hypothetical protein